MSSEVMQLPPTKRISFQMIHIIIECVVIFVLFGYIIFNNRKSNKRIDELENKINQQNEELAKMVTVIQQLNNAMSQLGMKLQSMPSQSQPSLRNKKVKVDRQVRKQVEKQQPVKQVNISLIDSDIEDIIEEESDNEEEEEVANELAKLKS